MIRWNSIGIKCPVQNNNFIVLWHDKTWCTHTPDRLRGSLKYSTFGFGALRQKAGVNLKARIESRKRSKIYFILLPMFFFFLASVLPLWFLFSCRKGNGHQSKRKCRIWSDCSQNIFPALGVGAHDFGIIIYPAHHRLTRFAQTVKQQLRLSYSKAVKALTVQTTAIVKFRRRLPHRPIMFTALLIHGRHIWLIKSYWKVAYSVWCLCTSIKRLRNRNDSSFPKVRTKSTHSSFLMP